MSGCRQSRPREETRGMGDAMRSSSLKHFTSALALTVGAALWSTQALAAGADSAPSHGRDAAAATDQNSTTVDTLEITAERRTDNLDAVPIAANVLSQANLDKKG